MIVIGLTGGIGMGKSTVAKMFSRLGIPGFNADEAVRALQARHGRALPAIEAAFPGTVRDGRLDRAKLRALVLRDKNAMRRLEAIMHPLVRREQKKFRAQAHRARRRAILLDIPLLFETKGARGCDVTLTVSCPRDIQIARVAKRGLPRAQIEAIIALQMPDAEKRRRADHTIPTGLSKFHTIRAVRRVKKALLP